MRASQTSHYQTWRERHSILTFGRLGARHSRRCFDAVWQLAADYSADGRTDARKTAERLSSLWMTAAAARSIFGRVFRPARQAFDLRDRSASKTVR